MNDEMFTEIDSLLKFFSYKFPFSVHDSDDIYQQGWVFVLEALDSNRFDPKRASLKSFLFSVLYSRFINMKRNEYFRAETPCRSCPFAVGEGCEVFSSKPDCPLFSDWSTRNEAKRSIAATPLSVPLDHPENQSNKIDLSQYPPHLHSLILHAATGGRLTKNEKRTLEEYFIEDEPASDVRESERSLLIRTSEGGSL